MNLNNVAISEIKVQNLERFTNPLDLNEVKLFCSVKVSNKFLMPTTKYKIVLKIKNVKEKNSRSISSDILFKKINEKINAKEVLDSIVFTKSYSSQSVDKEKNINFNAIIRKNELVFDERSSFFSKGIFLINVFLTTEKNEIVSFKSKYIDLNSIPLLRSKDNNYIQERIENNAKNKLHSFLKTIRFFSKNKNNSFIDADLEMLTGLTSELSLQNYKVLIRLSNNVKTASKLIAKKSIINVLLEIDMIEFFNIVSSNYSFSNKKALEKDYIRNLLPLIKTETDIFVDIMLFEKITNKSLDDKNVSYIVEKEKIDAWFVKLFYNIYLKNYFKNKARCNLLNEEDSVYSFSFENTRKEDLLNENFIFEKYLNLVKVKMKKTAIVEKNNVAIDVFFINDDRSKTRKNISKESFDMFNNKHSQKSRVKFNFESKFLNKSDCEYIDVEYFLKNDSYDLGRQKASIKVNNIFKESQVIEKDIDKSSSSYYSISFDMNNSIKKNVTIDYKKENKINESLEAYIDLSSLIRKEYYSFLGYENESDFLKSILVNINVEVYSGDELLFSYKNLSFLEKFFDQSFITKNIIENNLKHYSVYSKDYTQSIMYSDVLSICYFFEIAAVRKENYDNICKNVSNSIKSNLYKDAYEIDASKNFTTLEKVVNIIHSNNTDFEVAKSKLFETLYSKDLTYRKKIAIKSKGK